MLLMPAESNLDFLVCAVQSQMNQRSSDDFGDFAGADQPTSEGLEGTPLIPGGDLD